MKLTAQERRHQWQQHIDQWQASGLSGAAYCEQHELTYHCFVYWRSKFANVVTTKPAQPTSDKKTLPAFIPVQRQHPMPSESSRPDHHLQLRLPNGLEIHNIHDNNLDTVRSLLGRL